MKLHLLTTLVLFCVFSCTTKKEIHSGYTLTGEIKAQDSTWLYLEDFTSKSIDSTLVINGKFSFRGQLPDSVKTRQVLIRFKNFSSYRLFWIENTTMTITDVDGTLANSKIWGSSTQSEEDAYMAIIKSHDIAIDSISRALFDPAVEADLKKFKLLEKKQTKVQNEKQALSARYIKDHPHSLFAIHLLNVYATTWGRKYSQDIYQVMSNEMKQSAAGKEIQQYLTLNKDIKVGDHYVNFTQSNAKEEKVSLSDFSGKVILLDFWASWCMPCREANPDLVKLYGALHSKGFEIVGVSLDNNLKGWQQAIDADHLTWPNLSDLNGPHNAAALIYGISSIPDNFIIDRSGIIVARGLRGDSLRIRIEQLMK